MTESEAVELANLAAEAEALFALAEEREGAQTNRSENEAPAMGLLSMPGMVEAKVEEWRALAARLGVLIEAPADPVGNECEYLNEDLARLCRQFRIQAAAANEEMQNVQS